VAGGAGAKVCCNEEKLEGGLGLSEWDGREREGERGIDKSGRGRTGWVNFKFGRFGHC
jgi:hypothetical protein